MPPQLTSARFCTGTCTCISTYTCKDICACISTYTCTYNSTCVCDYTCTYSCTCFCTSTDYLYLYLYLHLHLYLYLYLNAKDEVYDNEHKEERQWHRVACVTIDSLSVKVGIC